ncbi:uncharacterized protein LOC115253693 isoform X1 [Aedes albopictus]|uniref:Single domain-containing protein n=1 Tax=Aedes albopictus TaxID=7160 RepID=A0ABM1Y4B9_AEDAL
MKAFAVSFTLCCLIAAALAARMIQPNATHPDHPGKCYHRSSGLVFDVDEKKTLPGTCMLVLCSEDYSLIFHTCGVAVMDDDPDCEPIEQDFTKNYPECCNKYKCVRNGEVNYI